MTEPADIVKSWILPSGVDPESAYKIEVKVDGYWNKQDDGKKLYVKGRTLKWIVDSDRFSLCELRSGLLEELTWGSLQTSQIWILDKNEGTKGALQSESQIPEMFKMYERERLIFLSVVLCDLDEFSNYSASNSSYPCTPFQPTPAVEIGSQSQTVSHSDGEDDHDDHGCVGLNDEFIYMSDGEVGLDQEVQMDVLGSLSEEPSVEGEPPIMTHDPNNPKIAVGASFPSVDCFRRALRQFAIQKEFEVATIKSDRKRFIGKCKSSGCPWRIHASVRNDDQSFVVKVLPHEHTCPSISMVDGKMASKSWVADRVSGWLKKNPGAGAKAVNNKLEDDFNVRVKYHKAWEGRLVALNQIHGSWEDSFQILFNFKHELEQTCPGSIIEIEVERDGSDVRFSRVFMALKPCIDGFVNGCRPYVGVDSTHLTGKYTGQLATACGIDGHTWLYPVAFAVFDLETTKNWTWFMSHLRRAIGSPPGLAISSDAGKRLIAAIATIFPDCEHRECFRHLMTNFKKKFYGKETNHMKPAAYAYTVAKCQHHLNEIKKTSPKAIAYLENDHKALWCRSQFSELTKVDYVTNNISECFNSWIKELKGLHVVDLLDQIRQQLLEMFNVRRIVGEKLQSVILPCITKQLNAATRRFGKVRITRGGNDYGEVTGADSAGNLWRHVMHLNARQCSCREWQLTGIPCLHATAFICSLRGFRLEDYVHEYYSLVMFRAAYEGKISALTDKSQWAKVDLGYKVLSPLMKRSAGRPRKERIPGCLETKSKRQQCKRCKQYGHQERTCKDDEPLVAAKKRQRSSQTKGSGTNEP